MAGGQELLELTAPLLFCFSSSVKEFPATEVAVWASSSFCHYGWLEFPKKTLKTWPTHTSVYPGLPSVPLACWSHRVAPCSTYISSTFSSSAEVVKVVLSDTSLLFPGTYQNPRALGISACHGLVNDFFRKNIVFLQLMAYHYHLCSVGHYTLCLACFHCSVNFEKLWVKLSLVKEKETIWLFQFIWLKRCSKINEMWVCVRAVWLWSHFPATMGQNMMPLLVWSSEMASWMLSLKCSEGSYSKHRLGLAVWFHISPCMNKSKSKPVRGEIFLGLGTSVQNFLRSCNSLHQSKKAF